MSNRINYNVGLLRVPPKFRAPKNERSSSSSSQRSKKKKTGKGIDSFLRDSQL